LKPTGGSLQFLMIEKYLTFINTLITYQQTQKSFELINMVCVIFFYSPTVRLDTIKVFYLPTDAQESCFKRILKFTLKQLLHVSVQSPSSESVIFELAKVIIIKIIS